MTPLAYQLLQDLTTGGAFKCSANLSREELRAVVTQNHFFDATAIWKDALPLAEKAKEAFEQHHHFSERLAFLPAGRTWLEGE